MSTPDTKDPQSGRFSSALLKGKPNPHADPEVIKPHQFQPGNRGRPIGTRVKIGEKFLKAIAADFDENGVAAIAKMRETDPSTYVKVIAGLLPKELEIKRPVGEMSDDELAVAIELIRIELAAVTVGARVGIT